MKLVAAAVLACTATAAAKPPVKTVDKPVWVTSSKTLVLAWNVGPDEPRDEQLPLVPVELVATIDGISRRISLDAETGALFPYNQIACNTNAYSLDKGEVGKITFYEGGASGYVVKRVAPDLLEVYRWSQGDGACPDPKGEPTACAPHFELHAKIPIPPRVAITGNAITIVDDHHRRQLLSCRDQSP